MNEYFTHPHWLLLLIPAVPYVVWFGVRSDVSLGRVRKGAALGIRLVILLAVVLALAGLQWHRRVEGMNVYYLLDRSESIPAAQQLAARDYVNRSVERKEVGDLAGVIAFAADTGIEFQARPVVKLEEIQAVVDPVGTDLAGAIRLATAAFPEVGQKRIVLLSDGNQTQGDALEAALSAESLGVSIDVVPLGAEHKNDVRLKNLSIPSNLKKGQTFDVKIFVESDVPDDAVMRFFRNDQFMGEQRVRLEAGKNLFALPQTLDDTGFFSYEVKIESAGDKLIQNNQAASYTTIRGDPQVLVISSDPEADQELVAALESNLLEVRSVGMEGFPLNLAELQAYDAIFLSNIPAGERSRAEWRLVESAVRDFGVGLVCIGGDQAFGAGGYRGTPLETFLPVKMELDSKKILPRGALVLVMHGMEFNNGNQVARDIALGCLDALGPEDEMGILLWDGTERWLFELDKVGDKKKAGHLISGMNQGDLPSFQGIMAKGHQSLKDSTANLKHMIVFSDGDPGPPGSALMQAMVNDKITVSSVLISGHSGPETMIEIAEQGRGRFYNVMSPSQLPQVFLKETAVILKAAIIEEPFTPQVAASSEVIRGISNYPELLGYVATSFKSRADTPLLTHRGDPLLAHWQYGLGRTVAFTADARPQWGRNWLNWDRYRQFWTQVTQWSLRKLETSNLSSEVRIQDGEGVLTVEALDEEGDFRNFLELESTIVDPKGVPQKLRLKQSGPGRYEARFSAEQVGAYQLNLMDLQDGQVRGMQSLGASLSYSPEFNTSQPNLNLLYRLAELTGGAVLDPFLTADNPFLHDRVRSFRPVELWPWLLRLAILLFVIDVGVRRIFLDRDQLAAAWLWIRRNVLLQRGTEPVSSDPSLDALLSRRQQVREQFGEIAPVSSPPGDSGRLFESGREWDDEESGGGAGTEPASPVPPSRPPEPPAAPESSVDDSPASRLLRAKRRAQKWKGK